MVEDLLDDLTSGEAFLINRRRQKLSQKEFADSLGISRNTYGDMERGKTTEFSFKIPEVANLTLAEKCLLIRKRRRMTQEQCARISGVTRFWFNQNEREKRITRNKDILEFWSGEDDE